MEHPTEKIKQEKIRLETARQQEQFKKLESLKTMTGAIAHRFNNAMNAIREINPALPIVLSSGYSENDFSFNESDGNEPDDFLRKPFRLAKLQSSLEKLSVQA